MQHSFTAQIDEWVLASKARMLAVFQTATQYVVEDMLDRTPVDTGYLRASLTVKFNTPAQGKDASSISDRNAICCRRYA